MQNEDGAMEFFVCIMILALIGIIRLICKIVGGVVKAPFVIADKVVTQKQEYRDNLVQEIEQMVKDGNVRYQRALHPKSIKQFLEDYDASMETLVDVINMTESWMEIHHPTPQEQLEALKADYDWRARNAIESCMKHSEKLIRDDFRHAAYKRREELETFIKECELLKHRNFSRETLDLAQEAINHLSDVVEAAAQRRPLA